MTLKVKIMTMKQLLSLMITLWSN